MDICVMSVYSKDIAPEPGSCTPEFRGPRRTGVFLLKGKSPRELIPPTANLSRRTGYPVRQVSALTEESVMGIIAWIVLGLVAGLIANALIPGRRQQGLILTCVIGIVGALLGGWLATKLFHIPTLHGFFNLDTWLTAIIGAALFLLPYHLFPSRSGTSTGRRRTPRRYARR